MKNSIKFLWLFFLLAFIFINCGKKDEETKPAENTNQTTTSSNVPNDAKVYDVKSGIVTFNDVIMKGMTQIFYFDDYGKKEARYTTMEMEIAGQKIRSGSVEINVDGYLINYDIEKKEGTKTKSYGSIGGTKDLPKELDKLSKELMDKYHLKEIAPKEVLGKQCKGYEIETMGINSKVWIWNNIMLSSVVQMSKDSKPIEMTASKIETDVQIPPEKFQVPADVKIKEL